MGTRTTAPTSNPARPELGLIEGFYGPLWPEMARLAVVDWLAAAGYGFYHYAPKADPAVRSDWRHPNGEDTSQRLQRLRQRCHASGMRFGVGLTPLGINLPPETTDYRDLGARVDELDALGVDELLIGFDDTYGARSDLAARQAELVHWVAGRSRAERVCVCPTYYSHDTLLDELFGPRPAGYLAELGRQLDPALGVYGAGDRICPTTIPRESVEPVAEALDRWPLLWDNYPVNDGPTMAPHLHLRAPTGRPSALADCLAGHAVNPALQPRLSLIPALALAERYATGEAYDPRAAFRRAAEQLVGYALASRIEADLTELQDVGRDNLADPDGLRGRYAGFDQAAAREIVAWLDGA